LCLDPYQTSSFDLLNKTTGGRTSKFCQNHTVEKSVGFREVVHVVCCDWNRSVVPSYRLFRIGTLLLILMCLMTFGRPSWWSRQLIH